MIQIQKNKEGGKIKEKNNKSNCGPPSVLSVGTSGTASSFDENSTYEELEFLCCIVL